MTRSRATVPLLAAAVFLGGAVGGAATAAVLHEAPAVAQTEPCTDPAPEPTPDPTPTEAPAPAQWVSPILDVVELPGDIQVTGSVEQPQVVATTDPITFDGGPVRVEFSANYANMIPNPASSNNGIGFDLFVDGVKVERLGLWGSHSQISMFGPVSISTVLQGDRAIPAGEHTVSIAVFKWSPGADGYLKAGSSTMPIQLVVSRA